MKILLKPFAALAILWQHNEFWRARIKLTAIYVVIMAVILCVFSLFLYTQVQEQLITLKQDVSSHTETIGIEQAAKIAIDAAAVDVEVSDLDEEVLRGSLVYVVELKQGDHEIDVYVDKYTGEVVAFDEEGVETFNDLVINDLAENLWLANGVILLLVLLLSYYFAGWSLRPVQYKLQQQERFSNDVAHELRTPLSAMLASVGSVLRQAESNETYQEALNDFKKETKRLITVTEDMLSSTSTKKVDFNEVKMSAVLETVTQRLRPLANQKQVRLVLKLNEPLIVYGNQLMLERMIENIVHNAIKFSNKEAEVFIAVDKNLITIKDTGIGISKNKQTQIFERFYTTDIARDERNKGGSGLGLAIAKQIADLHNIKIELVSEINVGTTVTVKFLQ